MHTNTKKRRLLALGLAASLLWQFAWVLPVRAAATNIYLSPGSQTAKQGNTFTVAVGISTAATITAAKVNLSYPSSQISFQDVSYSGSAFETTTDWAGGGGSIRIGRSSASTVTGDLPLAVLTFKVVATSGVGTITIQNTSTLENAGTPVTTTYGSATLDFGAAPATTPQKTSPTVTRLANPADAAADFDLKPPVMSDVHSEQTDANQQTITWKTDEPSSSKVEYGRDSTYGLVASDSKLVKSHKLVLESPFLVPNAQYHYKVTSVDENGNTVYSTDFEFTMKGVLYTVTVLGSDGKPLPHAAVTLNAQTVYTDGNGKAVLSSSTGKQALTVKFRDATVTRTVTIAENTLQQTDSVKLAAVNSLIDGRYIIYPILVAIGIFLGLATRATLLHYPLAILRKGKVRLLTMPISKVQMEFGDKNPAHNPYQARRIFSFWGMWDFVVGIFRRPSALVSKKVREEVRAAGQLVQPGKPPKK